MRLVSSFILIAALAAGCATAKNTPQLTPEARRDYNLTTVADSIGKLQLAAENATVTKDSNGKPILSIPVARRIVQFCVDANTAVGSSPNGWCPVVASAYQGLKNQLSAVDLSTANPWFTTFEAALATQGCTVQ